MPGGFLAGRHHLTEAYDFFFMSQRLYFGGFQLLFRLLVGTGLALNCLLVLLRFLGKVINNNLLLIESLLCAFHFRFEFTEMLNVGISRTQVFKLRLGFFEGIR